MLRVSTWLDLGPALLIYQDVQFGHKHEFGMGMGAYLHNTKSEVFIMMRDAEKTIGNLIDKAKLTFISYMDADGFPITKAMLAPRKREGIKTFWFSTNTSSNKVKYFRENPKASIYFIDKRFFRGASLSGTVEVLETAEAKEQIWRTGDTMYYHGGVTDPDYCVLKFTATKGRYYSNFKSEDFEIEAER